MKQEAGEGESGPCSLSSSKHILVAGALPFPEEQCWARISLPTMGRTAVGWRVGRSSSNRASSLQWAWMDLWGQRARTKTAGFKAGRGLGFLRRNELIAFSLYCCSFSRMTLF